MRTIARLCGMAFFGTFATVASPSAGHPPGPRSDCFPDCSADRWTASETYRAWLHEDGKSREVAGMLGETPTSVEAITLMRSPCLGTCPSYSVTLRADGSVSWEGYCCVELKGKRTGTIYAWQFRRLAALVSEIGFFELEHGYQVNVTDLPAAYVSIRQADKTKTVMDYASGGPARLWALEQLIDATVKDVKWKK